MVNSRVSKRAVLEGVLILDVASDFSISLEPVSSGNFNYRCKCPSPEHKHGFERTSSCYIDGINNNFYCFGCNANNNVIDFYMLCTGDSFLNSLSELSKRVSCDVSSKYPEKIRTNNFSVLINTSILMRDAMANNPDDFDWLDKVSERLDEHILNIGFEDKRAASLLCSNLKKALNKRYS